MNSLKLLEMFTYMRPAWSKEEREFIARFIEPYEPRPDKFGNQWIKVGEDPKILWSSHTDTVHRTGGRQRVQYDLGYLELRDWPASNCLGADDTLGVWMMLEMIERQVPGLYIFHRAEEVGGQGSRYIALKRKKSLANIDFAIAFDRKGYNSVITHQGVRTASDAFAEQLAGILNDETAFSFKPDDKGIFTDTANYTDLIGECTNLSVGYFMAHGPKESADLDFAHDLLERVIGAGLGGEFDQLVAHRKPCDYEPRYHHVPIPLHHWSGVTGAAVVEGGGIRMRGENQGRFRDEAPTSVWRNPKYDQPKLPKFQGFVPHPPGGSAITPVENPGPVAWAQSIEPQLALPAPKLDQNIC